MLYGHLREGFVDPQRQEKDTGEGGGVSEVMLGKGSFRLREEPEVQKPGDKRSLQEREAAS